MQGYIINIKSAKNQDLILHILTKDKNLSLYRFYGARHSILQIGQKIDFEIQLDDNFMPKLRNVTELGVSFMHNKETFYIYQQFLVLLDRHLYHIEEGIGFYFGVLEDLRDKIAYGSSMRCVVEAYFKILEFEGRRVNFDSNCIVCHRGLDGAKDVAIMMNLNLAHAQCAIAPRVDKELFIRALNFNSTALLDDEVVLKIYKIMKYGL